MIICLALVPTLFSAQIKFAEDAGCDTCYYSLEDAMANKDQVICLDLTKSRLKDFPIEVLEFKNLEVLLLNRNKITMIPQSISQLQSLRVLAIYRNRIEDMSPLCNLPNLEQLDISDNFIEAIPDDINKLKSLKKLYLGMNVIGHFPATLGMLENLEYLDLTENEMNRAEQDYVRNLLPKTDIDFSPPCYCNFD